MLLVQWTESTVMTIWMHPDLNHGKEERGGNLIINLCKYTNYTTYTRHTLSNYVSRQKDCQKQGLH